MNKEEIVSLFKKYKVKIPKEKQGQSECYECKRHHKYSLTWTSFLYEYKENYYCFEHIAIILLQQENQGLKKQLEEKNNSQIFIDTQDMEERYAEGLYQDYLEEENKKYKNQQKEFISYLENCINELKKESMNKLQNTINLGIVDITKEILSKYKSIIGVANEKNNN